MKRKTSPTGGFNGLKLGTWVIAFVLIIMTLNPIVIVGPGERGVVMEWSAVTGEIFTEGMHWKTPIVENVQIMDVRTQKYVDSANSASRDLQDVTTEVALNYHLNPERVDYVFQTLGTQFGDRVIAPAIEESVKASTAQFTAEELITKRAQAKDTIKMNLYERLEEYGIIVETVSITNFEFSPEFSAAIEAKVTAKERALQAENDLIRIKTEAQQEIAMAEAEAKAIQIKGDALKQNPELVQLEWVNKWNGNLPQFMTAGGTNMLMDVSNMMG